MATELHDKGLAMRSQVLGEAPAQTSTGDGFSQPLQEVLNEYVWGAVWCRPGLSPHTRSMITIAMLAAQHRSSELKAHIRGALRVGVSREEIAEILLHANVYCGAPAALDAFRAMREVFAEPNPA